MGLGDDSNNSLGTLFKDVKYYVVGSIPSSAESLLIAGGGRKDNYLSEMISHVIADDVADDEVNEAKDLFRLPVVMSSWILMSAHCRCLLPTCTFDPDPKRMIFSGLTICPSKLSRSDGKLIWVLVTVHGGKFQTTLDKHVTHLVAAEASGAKYQKVSEAASPIHVVSPDWILDCVEAMSRIDELRYHPRLILSEEELAQRPRTATLLRTVQQSLPQQKHSVSEQSVQISAVSDTPIWARPSYAVVTAIEKPVFTTNAPVTVFPPAVVSTEQRVYSRTHLKSIGNANEYVKTEVDHSSLKHFATATSSSMLRGLDVTYCDSLPAASSSYSFPTKTAWTSSESRLYYCHDPCEHVPEDVCLLGCIFYIADYQKCVKATTLDIWRQVICNYGGQVDDSYSNRITHVLCEHQKSDVFQLALRDGKRLITAYWLNDCLLSCKMSVPSIALHFPYVFGKEQLCTNQIICMSNFVSKERERVKQMIALIGAKYTGYMTRANSLLIAKHMGGMKCEKARHWNIPVVSVKWLTDIILGDLSTLKLPINPCYTTVTGDESFAVDLNKVCHLLEGWKTPVKISKEMWKKFQSSPLHHKSRQQSTVGVEEHVHSHVTDAMSVQNVARLSSQSNEMPVVLFTGFDKVSTALLSKEVVRLGGRVVLSAVPGTTHLVAKSLLRTVKFLTALAIVQHVLTSDWIKQSSIANQFLDENQFELVDERMEEVHGFRLKESLCRAHKKHLFKDLVFYFTPGIQPSKSLLVTLVIVNGGRVIESLHQLNSENKSSVIVISCEEDLYLCGAIAKDVGIYNVDFVFTGVFRQEIDYRTYRMN